MTTPAEQEAERLYPEDGYVMACQHVYGFRRDARGHRVKPYTLVVCGDLPRSFQDGRAHDLSWRGADGFFEHTQHVPEPDGCSHWPEPSILRDG